MKHLLTQDALEIGICELIQLDPSFEKIIVSWGQPPLWQREPGFATLIHIILEQQVSLTSANAAYQRLKTKLNPITPTGFLQLTHSDLKQIGFSRQKISYGQILATTILNKRLDLAALEPLDDQTVREQLMSIKGIGIWTANIYLLMVLGRPDIWPKGDLALQTAIQQLKGLPKRPTSGQAQAISEQWRPWRAVAARLLWHLYLSERRQSYPT